MTMVKSLVQRAELCMSVVDVGQRTARVMLSFNIYSRASGCMFDGGHESNIKMLKKVYKILIILDNNNVSQLLISRCAAPSLPLACL